MDYFNPEELKDLLGLSSGGLATCARGVSANGGDVQIINDDTRFEARKMKKPELR